jgi:hypothetical protein
MSSNPYIPYYVKQVGSGISHYQGVKFQHGKGFFANLWKSALLPFLKTAGLETARASLGLAEDALAGKNMKQSAKARYGATGQLLASDAIKRAHGLLDQEGSGKKRRKTNAVKATKADKCIKKKPKRKKASVGPKSPKGKGNKPVKAVKKPRKKTGKKKKGKTTDLFPF